ncbi:MAG: Tol-Pal system beta propeller repeat protein TolB [Rhodospirillaceae bacterium]|nr:Tol-Pal system beta propeller repeat protein TolB [Rhodospirillaceae bacterium]
MFNKAVQRRLAWAAFVCAVTLVGLKRADAQIVIEVTRGVERPVPMAIVPFGWEGPGSQALFDVASLVSSDLANSGRFAPMAVEDMVARPTRPAEVRFQDWLIVDVDYLVIGELLANSDGSHTVVFQLFNVLQGEQIVGYRLTTGSSAGDLRVAAHRVADMIFEELTGIQGVFGTQIAYVNEQRMGAERRFQLIVSDSDGANPQVVTESSEPLMSPAWSPDGRKLAYVSFEGSQSSIYVQELRTGIRDRVSSRAGINGAPVFSPDGRMLALTLSRDQGNLDVYMLDIATQILTRLTQHSAIDTEAVWAPDGESIYFTSDRAGGPQVYRVEARYGARVQRITYEGSYNARPRISPDGDRLAVVHDDRGNHRIALVDPETGLTQVLSNGSLDESPDFAPNGALIIYATREGGRGVLASVSTDGRIRQQIASVAGQVREPVWSPFPRI